MKRTSKFIFTIPSLLSLIYLITFWFPVEFKWLYPTTDSYHIQMGVLWIINLATMVLLIKKLWSFPVLEKSKKWEWTWALIFFTAIASLIFIWNKADKYSAMENEIIP